MRTEGSYTKTVGFMPVVISSAVKASEEIRKMTGGSMICMSGGGGGSGQVNGRAGIFEAQEDCTMQGYYEKFVDRLVPPKLEKTLHLGRRSEEERRHLDERRGFAGENNFNIQDERRSREESRRGLTERRQRWFRMSQYRSRHV